MTRLVLAVFSASVLGFFAGAGRASPIVTVTGGTATLHFTVDLDALDVSVTPGGNATLPDPLDLSLPVTDGMVRLKPLKGEVDTDNSGMTFSVKGVDIELDDLKFMFNKQKVKADISNGSLDLSMNVFNLVRCNTGKCTGATDPKNQYGLFLRAQAADFFENDVFGSGSGFDDGDQIALATFDLTTKARKHGKGGGASTPVPEPAVLTFVGAGLASLASLRRRSV